uniref:Matrix extracellular phosphoglycoprotein n=1 Tax=Choloepus hoffmanni TaxID=9358 RepID=D6C6P4_CHOHO|nr:matrix extracellular phosphoglycoprotein [Choloepus hoffmanni]
MQVVCLGLLLFTLAWAAPTFQPQTEKTKQDCVEEQRITYKGHHEKHGSYIYKYVYTSSGRKNQTDVKQEERNKDNIALHHLGKKRKQEAFPKENIVQERDKNFSLYEANENNQSGESQNLFANSQTLNGDHNNSNKENAQSDLNKSMYPAFPGNKRAENGSRAISELHDQEEYGTALVRNNMRNIMGPVTAIGHLGDRNKKKKLTTVLSKIPAGVNYADASPKARKNHQRDAQAQTIPVKRRSIHQIQRNTAYLKQLPKVKKIPSDFEGSGYTELQERGDNNISPFSGDGQPFEDILGKGGATVVPDLDHTDVQTGFSRPSESGTPSPDTMGLGYNEIPEKEDDGRNGIGTREATAKEAAAPEVRLVEGGNDIIGSTNFKELPGKEGDSVDAGSQNVHQGKVEFHYPHGPSKEERKGGSGGTIESTNYNEIPKNGKGSSRKSTGGSTRHQVSVNEKQRFSAKGKSKDPLIPSRGVDNEIENEIGPHNGPDNEGNTITHSSGRKNHYTPHGQNNSIQRKGMLQRKGSWYYRKPQSRGNVRYRGKDDSSESSESDSSGESDGD